MQIANSCQVRSEPYHGLRETIWVSLEFAPYVDISF